MNLNIKNIEYMIAKTNKMEEPFGEVKTTIYKVSRNHEKFNSEEYLEISIYGKIGNNEYPMHFIIAKPIEEYLEIEKYKSINIDEKNIMDSYMMIDGLADLDLEISNLKVTRFSSSLVFTMFFNIQKEYYGNAEFEVYMEWTNKF